MKSTQKTCRPVEENLFPREYEQTFNNQTTRPRFLRADSQQGTAELTIARRKRG